MKVTPQIQRQPNIKGITLELTPREAFLLMTLVGNMNVSSAKDIINKPRYGNHTPYVDEPVKDVVPKEFLGQASFEEVNDLTHMYFAIQEAFEQAK